VIASVQINVADVCKDYLVVGDRSGFMFYDFGPA
jgi:hypothetical protein